MLVATLSYLQETAITQSLGGVVFKAQSNAFSVIVTNVSFLFVFFAPLLGVEFLEECPGGAPELKGIKQKAVK